MKWRRVAVIVLIVVAGIVAYRSAVVVCTSLKLLGYSYFFDLWRGPISRTTLHIGTIPVDLYTGNRSRVPVVLIHGVNETGKGSSEVRAVAEGLAGSGFRVFVPELVRMTHQNVTPQDIEDVAAVINSLQTRTGLACASYGCGPALIAASRPEIRNNIRFIVTFGAYFDLTETLRFIITSPPNPLAYSKWIYMAANLDLLDEEKDRMSLLAIANERASVPSGEWRLGCQNLGPEGRAMLGLFEAQTGEEFDERLTVVPALRDRMIRLSPSVYFNDLKADLIMVHMASDPSIPASESIQMAKVAKQLAIPYSLTILNVYGHTKPAWPEIGIGSIFHFYVPEGLKAMRVVNEIMSYGSVM